MRNTSNWPGGVDYGHSNFTGRTARAARYDGVGGWAKDSYKIPLIDAVQYVGGTVAVVWAALRVAFWIWGQA